MAIITVVNGIKQTFLREVRRIISRPIYLLASVGIMAFCFVFYLTFFSEGQPERIPVSIVDLDQTAFSRQFLRNIQTLQHVKIISEPKSITSARAEMQRGNTFGFVYIKKGFYKDVVNKKRPHMTFYVNNSFLVAGSLITKDISYLSLITSAGIQRQVLRAKGFTDNQIPGEVQPIMIDMHGIANPWINYGTYLLNLLLPAMLHLMTIMLTAYCIGIEIKLKTSAEWLQSANGSMFAAITGKLLPYTILFGLLGIITNLLLYKQMHFPLHSSIGYMFVAVFMLILAGQALGVFFIGLLPVLRDSITISGIVGTLGITAAGATFPLDQLPYYLKSLAHAFPLQHYFVIYINQALNGLNLSQSLIEYMILLSFILLPLFIFKRLENAAQYMNYPTK